MQKRGMVQKGFFLVVVVLLAAAFLSSMYIDTTGEAGRLLSRRQPMSYPGKDGGFSELTQPPQRVCPWDKIRESTGFPINPAPQSFSKDIKAIFYTPPSPSYSGTALPPELRDAKDLVADCEKKIEEITKNYEARRQNEIEVLKELIEHARITCVKGISSPRGNVKCLFSVEDGIEGDTPIKVTCNGSAIFCKQTSIAPTLGPNSSGPYITTYRCTITINIEGPILLAMHHSCTQDIENKPF